MAKLQVVQSRRSCLAQRFGAWSWESQDRRAASRRWHPLPRNEHARSLNGGCGQLGFICQIWSRPTWVAGSGDTRKHRYSPRMPSERIFLCIGGTSTGPPEHLPGGKVVPKRRRRNQCPGRYSTNRKLCRGSKGQWPTAGRKRKRSRKSGVAFGTPAIRLQKRSMNAART